MIGSYKCGRESKTEVVTYRQPVYETIKQEDPQLYAEDENYDKNVQTRRYHLIVGSFTSIDLAQNYLNNLISEGFDPKLVEEDGYYRISIFSSIYINEVYDTKKKYSHRLEKMWVYNN
jgi:cell division protein FtsN